uniref:Carboxylic ester hydrolase n=2 Tax=Panagrellus redivivus TaxID=6233 RepID=A0A7E4W4G9_PANRE
MSKNRGSAPLKNLANGLLTLNIIRPNPTTQNAVLPVMVWIHGGDFVAGSGRDYKKENFADRLVSAGIIVVSINYRLGPFGFLSTGNAFAPGNYGLWDQVQALTFIQEVIPSFGGDPKQVTIFGQSAGGASVSWLTLRPETESLFSKAISMSGSAQAVWANTDGTVQSSRAVIREIGCDKVEDLPKCLQSASEADIINATQTLSRKDGEYNSGMRYDTPDLSHWNPRLDQDFLYDDTFKAAIKNAPKRPQLIGFNSQESTHFAIRGVNRTSAKYMPIGEIAAKRFRRPDFVDVVINILGTEDAFGQNAKAAAKAIIDYYEHNFNYQHDFFLQTFVQLCSDIEFNVPALREAIAKAKAGNNEIYVYEFSYVDTDGSRHLVDGASHGYDLMAILNGLKKEPKLAQEFVDVFVNFVKTGKPSTAHASAEPVDPAKSTKIPFLHVDVPRITVEPDLWSDRVAFWDALANKYGFDWPLGRETE